MALNMDAAIRIKAIVDGLGEINDLVKALSNTERQAKETGGALSRIKGVAGGLSGALGALIPAAGIGGLLALGKNAIDAADNLNDLNQRTGVSVPILSRFGAAAADSGSSVEEVGKALGKLSKGLVAATSGSDEYARKVKASSESALEAIKRGEREQTELVKAQGIERLDALQNETDSRLRELNKRYRSEQTLLDDRYNDQADVEREAADQSLREMERQISSRYNLMRQSIQDDETLSDQQSSRSLDNLKRQEEDELSALQRRFTSAQKLRDRQLRDARRLEEDALEERRRAEETIIKNNSKSQARVLEAATAEQLRGIQDNYKRAADAMETGSQGMADALARLGIAAVDSQNRLRPVDQIMLDVADKFSKMPDGAEKTALAMQLFGKSGANLIPMLNGGREAINQYAATIDTGMAQSADKFNDSLNAIGLALAGPFNNAVTALLPLITQVAQGIAGFAQWFGTLPQPLQGAIAAIGALAAAFVLLAPAITAVMTIFSALSGVFAGGAIFATIAGYMGAVVPAVTAVGSALSGLLPILAAVFTGPVGWIALIVAAGVAIFTFRDQIGQAFGAIGQMVQIAAQGLYETFIKPVIDWFGGLYESIVATMSNLANALKAPFVAVANMIKVVLNGILGGIENTINGAINAINALIQGANQALTALKLPSIPTVPQVSLPRFAEGGVVSGPTLAMVGEGGEPEYIVPQSKASTFAANWMAGVRGPAAIPRFAEGGVVAPATAQVNIQTGPVMQQGGQNYVTMQDFERGLQGLANQLLSSNRTSGGRRYAGVR